MDITIRWNSNAFYLKKKKLTICIFFFILYKLHVSILKLSKFIIMAFYRSIYMLSNSIFSLG